MVLKLTWGPHKIYRWPRIGHPWCTACVLTLIIYIHTTRDNDDDDVVYLGWLKYVLDNFSSAHKTTTDITSQTEFRWDLRSNPRHEFIRPETEYLGRCTSHKSTHVHAENLKSQNSRARIILYRSTTVNNIMYSDLQVRLYTRASVYSRSASCLWALSQVGQE